MVSVSEIMDAESETCLGGNGLTTKKLEFEGASEEDSVPGRPELVTDV